MNTKTVAQSVNDKSPQSIGSGQLHGMCGLLGREEGEKGDLQCLPQQFYLRLLRMHHYMTAIRFDGFLI